MHLCTRQCVGLCSLEHSCYLLNLLSIVLTSEWISYFCEIFHILHFLEGLFILWKYSCFTCRCNKVVCANCLACLCWCCLKDITKEGYAHFTKCQTFDLHIPVDNTDLGIQNERLGILPQRRVQPVAFTKVKCILLWLFPFFFKNCFSALSRISYRLSNWGSWSPLFSESKMVNLTNLGDRNGKLGV